MTPRPAISAAAASSQAALFDLDRVGGAGRVGTADVSACGRFRFRLTRRWCPGPPAVFVMCNPSVADATADDPTVRRCVGFARRLGCGGVHAYLATRPADLRAAGYPAAAGEDAWLALGARESLESGAHLVAAWGVHPLAQRVADVRALLVEAGASIECFGTTTAGHPRHPLRLRADTPLRPWEGPTP